ncbi:unnamed protein product, partial [marine sediment metagenome]
GAGESYFVNSVPYIRDQLLDLFAQSMVVAEFEDDIMIEEYYTSGDTSTEQIFGALPWDAQTFTPTDAYSISGVRLKLLRVGAAPGNVSVSLRDTLVGVPLAVDLAVGGVPVFGVTDGNLITDYAEGEWVDIAFNVDYAMTAGNTYGITVRVLGGNAANYVGWREDLTGTYAGGQAFDSANAGVAWVPEANTDRLFEVAGRGVTVTSAASANRWESLTEGTFLDFSNFARDWGMDRMMVSSIIMLIFLGVIALGVGLATRSNKLGGMTICLGVIFCVMSGLVSWIAIALIGAVAGLGVVYALYHKYA